MSSEFVRRVGGCFIVLGMKVTTATHLFHPSLRSLAAAAPPLLSRPIRHTTESLARIDTALPRRHRSLPCRSLAVRWTTLAGGLDHDAPTIGWLARISHANRPVLSSRQPILPPTTHFLDAKEEKCEQTGSERTSKSKKRRRLTCNTVGARLGHICFDHFPAFRCHFHILSTSSCFVRSKSRHARQRRCEGDLQNRNLRDQPFCNDWLPLQAHFSDSFMLS